MLLSFSVENYLSIRDRQTLDLRRVGDGTVSRLAIDGEPAGAVATPVAVICGANASGKSNLLDAMDYVQWLVRNSARREAGDPLPTRPFLLDAESKDRPFACSFRFMTAGREFSYAFSLHNGRVTGEELRETTQGTVRRSTRTLFSRQTDGNTANVTTSEALRGPKKAIIAATRPNSLFLSKAAQENFAPLLPVYDWFVDPAPLPSAQDNMPTPHDLGTAWFESDPVFKPWIVNLLAQADLGVTDVSIRLPPTRPPADVVAFKATSNDPDALMRAEDEIYRSNRGPQLLHRADPSSPVSGAIPWYLESRGTQDLWGFASQAYGALKSGRALIIDELSGLHPLLIRALLETFQSRHTNPNNAQLVFTSHDVALLGSWGGQGYMLDRDQVWFAEKDYRTGATELIRLSEYRPRKDEDTERLYLQGRYGGIPTVGRLSDQQLGGFGEP